jgi:hypothetical protein
MDMVRLQRKMPDAKSHSSGVENCPFQESETGLIANGSLDFEIDVKRVIKNDFLAFTVSNTS